MKNVRQISSFRKDIKRVAKRGYELDDLWVVVATMQMGALLQPHLHAHPLKGIWVGHWECHLAPDWLLIYKTTETEVVLVRTGTHTDLFNN